MRLLLIGAHGADKVTQAERMAERFGIAHISSGDLLDSRSKTTPRSGDDQVLPRPRRPGSRRGRHGHARKPAVAVAQAGGHVLDGFPRTLEQARASFPTAHALGMAVQVAVRLDVRRTEPVRRLLAGRCGSEDTKAVTERRLRVYLDKAVPLLEYYADREWVFTVDGAQPPDAVHEGIVACLRNLTDFAAWTRPGVSRR